MVGADDANTRLARRCVPQHIWQGDSRGQTLEKVTKRLLARRKDAIAWGWSVRGGIGGKLTHRHTTERLTRPEYCMRRSHGPLQSVQTQRCTQTHIKRERKRQSDTLENTNTCTHTNRASGAWADVAPSSPTPCHTYTCIHLRAICSWRYSLQKGFTADTVRQTESQA